MEGKKYAAGLPPHSGTWLMNRYFSGSSFVLAHTNCRNNREGRFPCSGLEDSCWRLVLLALCWVPWLHLLGILAWLLPFHRSVSTLHPTPSYIQSKRFGVGSPARNDYLYFLFSEQLSMEPAAPTAVRSPVKTMGIWGQVLVSVRDSKLWRLSPHCRSGLPGIAFNAMTLAWDMKC